MFQIQYIQNDVVHTIPITYEDFDIAKEDAKIFKQGFEKNIIDTKTQKIILNMPSVASYPKFLNF
jgi:hypothetical protein